MNSTLSLSFMAMLIAISVHAQQPADNPELQKINKDLPHKFKAIKTGATLEVVREPTQVKIYMFIDDIEQYDQIMVERSDELQNTFSQCKVVQVVKGKYKNNYVELVDRYPVSSKMSNQYRIKTITADGIMRMYPPVEMTMASEVNAKN